MKERILRVATIEEVVAAYVPLQRSGAGYVGLCPFHADKHPSLHVHPGKQFFKCFACGEGGDLFAFVQKIEGCSFTEAMGMLAKRYSIDSREWTVDNYAGKKKRTDGKGTTGKRTAGSPDKTANENSDDQLSVVNSQLSIRTIGAANRLFASLLQYVNSPASPVYSKSRVLYALDLAGEAIRERRFVFVTEGYKDALAMHAAGFTNTVALCGVAFTAGHLRLLAGYTQRIVLLLDADRAGEASMEKIVAMLSCGTDPEGERLEPACLFEVSRMQLPYGEDPDSLLHGSGFVSFRRQITASLHLALLETYEHRLLRQIAKTVSDLSLCLSCEDRISLLSLLAKQKSRLSRVTMRLGRNVVV